MLHVVDPIFVLLGRVIEMIQIVLEVLLLIVHIEGAHFLDPGAIGREHKLNLLIQISIYASVRNATYYRAM